MKVFRNFLSLAGAEVVSKLMTFAAFAYLARIAGPDGFGYVEFAGAILLCAGLIVDQGFSPYGAREIAKCPEQTNQLVAEICAARLALAVGTYALVIGFVCLHSHPGIVNRLLLIYGLSLLITPLLLTWVFQGHDRMEVVAVAQVLRQSVFAFFVFSLVRDGQGIWLVAVAEVLAVTCAAGYTFMMYRRQFRPKAKLKLSISPKLFREGVPIGLSQMFWMVRMYGATLMVGLLAATPQEIGFFAGAMRILVAVHTFVWLYYFNLLPSLSKAWLRGDDGSCQALVEKSMRAVVWTGAGAMLVWLWLAPFAVEKVYGAKFAPAGTTLQVMSGVFLLAALSGHYRFGLIAAGQQMTEMICSAIGAVIAALLIPLGYYKIGLPGAAVGLLVAEFYVWSSSWWIARSLLKLRHHLRLLILPLSLTLIMLAGVSRLAAAVSLSSSASAMLSVLGLLALALALDAQVRAMLCELLTGRRYESSVETTVKPLPEATR